jgi:hypothetical protein
LRVSRSTQDLALGHGRRLDLGQAVALGVVGSAGVGDDHAHDVAPVLALVVDPHRRDPDALAEVVTRRHVERARHAAAHVRPVAVGLGQAQQLALVEDRAHDPHVVEVRATEVRVVDGEHVARAHLPLEGVDHRSCGQVQRADVDRDVLAALHDRVALRIA